MNTPYRQPVSTSSSSLSSTMVFERLAGGDTSAFEDFMDRYGNWVACAVRRVLGPRAPDFDDAMQDALLTLWRAAPLFDRNRGAETTYIGTIVRRLAMDRKRKATRRRTASPLDLWQVEATPACPETDPRQDGLRAALDRLRPDERALVELAIVGGKSSVQIEQATGLPAETIRRAISRALARLRRDLTARGVAA